jgi:hypothetical protein
MRSVEGNFRESEKAMKPLIIEYYTTHVVYVDLSDRDGKQVQR